MKEPLLYLALRGAALAMLARLSTSVNHRVNEKNAEFS
jgi:hypothetical protein